MDMGERVSPFLATLPTTFSYTPQRGAHVRIIPDRAFIPSIGKKSPCNIHIRNPSQ
jgi:hypothetical protein